VSGNASQRFLKTGESIFCSSRPSNVADELIERTLIGMSRTDSSGGEDSDNGSDSRDDTDSSKGAGSSSEGCNSRSEGLHASKACDDSKTADRKNSEIVGGEGSRSSCDSRSGGRRMF